LKILLLVFSIIFLASGSPALAVVNGSEILDADITKPWVAQVYYIGLNQFYLKQR